jgi:hypothetical protein
MKERAEDTQFLKTLEELSVDRKRSFATAVQKSREVQRRDETKGVEFEENGEESTWFEL